MRPYYTGASNGVVQENFWNYMGNESEQHGEIPDTKKSILYAAIDIFAARGYEGATVRDICERAGAGNASAINYHFGGKDGLYRSILELMFSEFDRRSANHQDLYGRVGKPEERLRRFINIYCEMYYGSGEKAKKIGTIFLLEMARPSPFLDEMIEKYMIRQSDDFLRIIRDLLGEDAAKMTVRRCAASIIGQINYYVFSSSLYYRIFPDQLPSEDAYTDLSDFIYRFSLAGIRAIKESGHQGAK